MRRDMILMQTCVRGAEEPARSNASTREAYKAERAESNGRLKTPHIYLFICRVFKLADVSGTTVLEDLFGAWKCAQGRF